VKPTAATLLDSALVAAEVKCTLLRLLLETPHEDVRIQSITDRIVRLQRQIDHGHALIAAIKDRARRRAELEKLRDQHADTKTEQKDKPTRDDTVLRDHQGRVIGFRRRWDHADVFLNAGGQVVGREVDGRTLSAGGKLYGWGRQGVRLLKTSQKRSKPPLNAKWRSVRETMSST
jgi:hypothetical protein